MRFKNVKHAEYKILQHLKTSGALPLSVVMDRGVPGFVLGRGADQPLNKDDKTALKRYNTARDNLAGVINNMMEKRKKDVPEEDLSLIFSPYLDSWGNRTIEYGEEDDLEYNEEDELE